MVLAPHKHCQDRLDVTAECGFSDILRAKVDLGNCLCYHILISDPNRMLTFAGFLASTALTRGTCVTYTAASPTALGVDGKKVGVQ